MSPEMQRFLTLVNEHYRARHDVAFYSRRLGMGPGGLNRLCQSELGIGAKEVIVGRIIECAKELLTQRPAGEVAEALGFKDPGYFGRFFKRYSGRTATEFKKTAKS